ncbi:MAG: heparinase II/III family protein [Bacteroidetes bacterium]|nr:heparinase II/III family protein [Bacteroidota bacterium]MBS1755649.1 heparinase II/III family protein [Bacteroidota bacterium]
MNRIVLILCIFYLPLTVKAQHPITFFTKPEAIKLKQLLKVYPLLNQSFTSIKNDVDKYIGVDIDVPVPKDPAGGYTHDRHKANYTLMFNSGILYNLTGNNQYAIIVKNLLLKYAALNPTLKNHPQATSNSPGRIFWQALNDANWMVYSGMAYDLVYNALSEKDRKIIEDGAFKPEVDFFTHDLKNWFNLLHNHAVWACAGVGIIGIASHNNDYVEMALKGTAKDGKRGFIALMDSLFSPDGYYTEGPYYTRYALLPFVLFANALNNSRPSLKIFEHRNKILQKALYTCIEETNLDGRFFPLNDAIKEKDYTTNELVTAIDIFWKVYGPDKNLLPIVKKQGKVLLNIGGASIAEALQTNKNIPEYFPYKTIESTDGANGNEGGLSIFRNGTGKNLSSLLFKYTSHGLSHGHFDKLGIMLFDKGNEILTDYGSVRFVGIEQKYGGRYLPENNTYAEQTIAHNTITVDEASDFGGKEATAEKFHSQKLFSSYTNLNVQVASAMEDNAYPGTLLQRTVYMLQLPGDKKIIADIFNAHSAITHQYDLPFHYIGQLINTSFSYNPFTTKQQALGKKNGYQFLWKEAEATIGDTTIQCTFLNNGTYYSISSLIQDSAQIFFTRTGANDPNFNLRHEPAFIIRKKGNNQSFVNVVEIHGKYDSINELSYNSYPSVKQINLLQNDDNYTIAEIKVDNNTLLIAQCNKDFNVDSMHFANGLTWKGPFLVWYNGKKL